MENKFYNGFWNYVDTGVLEPEAAVRDWADLGMNLPMSFEYDPVKHNKKDLLKMLDACAARGMKVIICDKRTRFNNLTEKGAAEFNKDVAAAVKDFGSHPAAFGFHIGDEPDAKQMEDMAAAYKIVKAAAPALSPFINFFPYWDEPNFDEVLGVKGAAGYEEFLDKLVKDTGIEMLCYDYYGQCAYFENERYTDLYFQNLSLFGRVARRNNIPLWTTLLSVGHWGMRCPSEDDIRWQTSTALAYGCKGLLWFFVYERKLDGSYRGPPIDLFWERTETFTWLSRQNRTLMRYYAEKLDGMEFDCVRIFGGKAAGTKPFVPGEFEIESLEHIINPDAPALVSRFKRTDGGVSFLIVNCDKAYPVRLRVKLKPGFSADTSSEWYAPGQMQLIELE